jgi:hypothetical protein
VTLLSNMNTYTSINYILADKNETSTKNNNKNQVIYLLQNNEINERFVIQIRSIYFGNVLHDN